MSLLAELLEGCSQRSAAATSATVATQSSETARESRESRESQGCEHVIVGTRALTKAERRAIVDAYHELARTLAAHPSCPRAIRTVESGHETGPVLLAVAVRGAEFCTVRVPRERYDGVRVLEMMERHWRLRMSRESCDLRVSFARPPALGAAFWWRRCRMCRKSRCLR